MLKYELARRMLSNPQKRQEIDQADPNGNTLLMEACQEGNIDLVCLLLEHGADPSLQNHVQETPLAVAESNGFEDIAFLLRECMRMS